ncbi:hypothetical protein BJV82DRAFT_700539 [Fennellomyces sp. T-0311]|nr:hypothetical protein BJV82DRAFT_700539 [Fennellomyces sp. T-0311]
MTGEIALQSPKKRRRLDDLGLGNDAIEPTIQHYTNDGIITSLTQELERLDSRRVTVLISRSRALADKGRLTDAVSDALKAIKYGPTLAEGYLAAGEIYCIQGKQKEAVDVYECGLRTVLPSDWSILYERRKSATERMNRKIDFVANLPFEVTEAIFAQLQDHDHKQYIDCANTSRLWRSVVLYQCPMLWRTITVSKSSLYHRDSAARLLSSVGRHVQHLGLNDVPDRFIRTLLTLVEEKKVASVTELTLDQLVFSHLTDLSLMIMPEETQAAASILLQCPMLERADLCAALVAGPTSLYDICNSLILHDNVRILKFEGFESNTAGADFERLFTHYASSQSCKVQQISIIKCESWQVCESFLEPLACITTLRNIEVRGSFSYTERDSFALCVQRLKALPNLRSLAFEDMTCIRNEVLVRLVQIDGLESLELVDIYELSTKLVYILADNVSPTLKVCKIEKSYVTKEAMAYLESKLKGP